MESLFKPGDLIYHIVYDNTIECWKIWHNKQIEVMAVKDEEKRTYYGNFVGSDRRLILEEEFMYKSLNAAKKECDRRDSLNMVD